MKKYIQFIIEKLNIDDKIIWRNTFEYRGNSYRLQSWKYIYNLSDGSREFATVNKEDANGVSGGGVAGVVIELDKIKWLDETTNFSDDFIKQKEISNEHRIEQEKGKYDMLKNLPPNLNREEYDEITIIIAIGDQEELDDYIKHLELNRTAKKYNL